MASQTHDSMHDPAHRGDALWVLSSDAAIEVDRALTVVAANRAACRLLGCGESDVISRPVLDFIDTGERHALRRQLERSLDGEPCRGFDATFRFQEQPLSPVSLSMASLPTGGLVLVGRDRTEEVASQQMLEEAGEALANAESLARFGLWIWDLDSDVVQWSDGVHLLTGVGPHEFAGDLDAHLAAIPDDDRDRVRVALHEAGRRGSNVELEHTLTSPSGTRVVECRAHAVRSPAGDVVAIRGVLQDVTHARELEALLRSAADREHEAAESLRAADLAKDAFLATVSHELRTPITIFNGLLEVLRDGRQAVDDDLRDDLLRRMHRSAVDLRDMVERLLDFSRMQAGTIQLEINPVDLTRIVHRVVHRLAPLVEGREITVHGDDDVRVLADVNALEHVVSNLVTNAAKYSNATSAIRITVEADDDMVELAVADSGCGIEPEHIDLVFERFYRVPANIGGVRGTGVGLAVVKQYVDALDGTISVTSDPGVGSTFRVRLNRDSSR